MFENPGVVGDSKVLLNVLRENQRVFEGVSVAEKVCGVLVCGVE